MIKQERQEVYKSIEQRIGDTSLIKYQGVVPGENIIWIKRECDAPFGSHYDRVYAALFKHYEEAGKIKPGDKILETTSGAAGVSFAGIGKLLGYECFVAIPSGGEKARENAIKEQLVDDSHIIYTPSEEYISGFPKFLKGFLAEHKDYFFLNHSMGPRSKEKPDEYSDNKITLDAMAGIADEVMKKVDIDYFLPAVGNGSSVFGPGKAFKEKSLAKIIAFETLQSAAAYELKYPGKYEADFGIKPGTLERHHLPGTSYQGINFPHIIHAVREGVIDDVVLVSDKHMDDDYHAKTGKDYTKQLIHYDAELLESDDLGRTGMAGLAIALEMAKHVKKKNFLIIGYDKINRYDSRI